MMRGMSTHRHDEPGKDRSRDHQQPRQADEQRDQSLPSEEPSLGDAHLDAGSAPGRSRSRSAAQLQRPLAHAAAQTVQGPGSEPPTQKHVDAVVADLAVVHLESGAAKHSRERSITVIADNRDPEAFRDRLHRMLENGGAVYLVNQDGKREAKAYNLATMGEEDKAQLVNQIVSEHRTFDHVTNGPRSAAVRDAVALAGAEGSIALGDRTYDIGRIRPHLIEAQHLLHAKAGQDGVDEGTLRVAITQLTHQLEPHAARVQGALNRDPELRKTISPSLQGFLAASDAGFGVHAFEADDSGSVKKFLLELDRKWEDEPSVTRRLSAAQRSDQAVLTWMRGGLDNVARVEQPADPPADIVTTTTRVVIQPPPASDDGDGGSGGILAPVGG